MKTVVLVRHGEVGLSHPDLDDMDRPLRYNGTKNSIKTAGLFADLDIPVDLIISSPAVRAKGTAKVFADKLDLRIETDERLYDGTDSELLDVIQETDESCSVILLVGHNPGLSDLLRDLLDAECEDLVAASVAVVDFDVSEWADIHSGSGMLEHQLVPKLFDHSQAA